MATWIETRYGRLMIDSLTLERKDSLGIMTLNRPSALNTLSLELILEIRKQLMLWNEDPEIKLICLRGYGQKGFCAGGDVKTLSQTLSTESAKKYAFDFFWNEYRLDHQIYVNPKPVVVIGHGITMGGGLGLLAGATCRVVTPSTVMAMPEITIGLYTDVGASYFLPRIPHSIGLFLGLTATRFSGRDALFLGLADVLMSDDQIDSWLEDCQKELSQGAPLLDRPSLVRLAQKGGGRVDSDFSPSPFQVHAYEIDALMKASRLEELIQRFQELSAQDQKTLPWDLSAFFHGSPTSAHLIFEQYKRGRSLSLEDCFEMELNLSLACCRNHDFKEGVRALLIDKDKAPRWSPSTWSEVGPDLVLSYFKPTARLWSEK